MSDNKDSNMLGFFSVNLVALSGTQVFDSPPRQNTFFVAGCILDYDDEWFFITAGHCIQEFEQALQTARVGSIRLVGYVGSQATNHGGVSVNYKDEFKYEFVDERTGID